MRGSSQSEGERSCETQIWCIAGEVTDLCGRLADRSLTTTKLVEPHVEWAHFIPGCYRASRFWERLVTSRKDLIQSVAQISHQRHPDGLADKTEAGSSLLPRRRLHALFAGKAFIPLKLYHCSLLKQLLTFNRGLYQLTN